MKGAAGPRQAEVEKRGFLMWGCMFVLGTER